MAVTFHQREVDLALWFIGHGDVPDVDMAELVQHSTIPNLTETTATTMWHNLRRKIQGAGSTSTDPTIVAAATPVAHANSVGVDANNNRNTGTEDDENEEDMKESDLLVTLSVTTTPVTTASTTTTPATTTPATTTPPITVSTNLTTTTMSKPGKKPGFSAAMAKAKAAKKARKQEAIARTSTAHALTSETKEEEGTGGLENEI